MACGGKGGAEKRSLCMSKASQQQRRIINPDALVQTGTHPAEPSGRHEAKRCAINNYTELVEAEGGQGREAERGQGPLLAQRMGGFGMGDPSLPPQPTALLGPGPDLPRAWRSCLLPHDGAPAAQTAVDSIPYVSWPCQGVGSA